MVHLAGGAVPVDITERGALRIAHPINEALRHRTVSAGRAHHSHDIQRAIGQAAALHRMTHLAASGCTSHTTHDVSSSDTRSDGGIRVRAAAADVRGIAADIGPHLHRGRAAGLADSGVA